MVRNIKSAVRANRLEVSASDSGVTVSIQNGLTKLSVRLTPEQADELSVDIRSRSIEVRNGGATPEGA